MVKLKKHLSVLIIKINVINHVEKENGKRLQLENPTTEKPLNKWNKCTFASIKISMIAKENT